MKKSIFRLLAVALVATTLFVSCHKDEDKDYDPADLVALWQKTGTDEYWRFKSDKTGETWDEHEDVHEGEGTRFSWSLSGDELHVVLRGEMGQEVPRDYVITELNATRLTLEDAYYGGEIHFHKK